MSTCEQTGLRRTRLASIQTNPCYPTGIYSTLEMPLIGYRASLSEMGGTYHHQCPLEGSSIVACNH